MFTLAIFSIVCLALTGIATLNGWALQLLWGWFLTPLGLPEIGFAHAIGLVILVHSFITPPPLKKKKDKKDMKDFKEDLERCFMLIFHPLVSVLIGWLVHSFM